MVTENVITEFLNGEIIGIIKMITIWKIKNSKERVKNWIEKGNRTLYNEFLENHIQKESFFLSFLFYILI